MQRLPFAIRSIFIEPWLASSSYRSSHGFCILQLQRNLYGKHRINLKIVLRKMRSDTKNQTKTDTHTGRKIHTMQIVVLKSQPCIKSKSIKAFIYRMPFQEFRIICKCEKPISKYFSRISATEFVVCRQVFRHFDLIKQ